MKVLVGMSGGIDSSVAAYLLKNAGYDVTGVTMLIWNGRKDLPAPKHTNSCYSPEKAEDVAVIKEIAGKIGIPHVTVDLSLLYEDVVLRNFHDEYLSGRTPNPCIWCNAKIKFGAMLEYARAQGLSFDKFATGHYARIVRVGERYAIARAADARKDQSYFLYRLSQDQLGSILYPLGEMLKTDVRKIDVEQGFHPEGQEESQDFYGGDYTDLLDVKDERGDIVMKDGTVIGHHEGIWHYTIGQRKGLGVAAPRPLYVLALRPEKNQVVVGYEEDTESTTVSASRIAWGAVDHIDGTIVVQAKIRSTGFAIEANAWENPDGSITAKFITPVKAATAGQSLVLYQDDHILCGGIITSPH
ncbi:MAG: tRNA 2-thiouridine(34) synthase MnmA [Sphaerochaetaceae bacterium]